MTPKRSMSDAHKAALAQGRESGQAVRAYLAVLEANRPKRGRKVTLETLQTRLNDTKDKANAERVPLRRLQLIQRALDLEAEIERRGSKQGPDLAKLENDFVTHAKAYGDSKGISYSAWREIGVETAVLKAAGITRSSA